MRIALLTTNMARGGAETLVAHLATALKHRGHDVHVVSMLPATAFTAELAQAGVPLHAPGLYGIPFTLAKIRPEVLHCHMFHANLCGRLLRMILPFPAVISTLHSVAESKRGSDGNVRWRDLGYRVTDRLADAVVGVSQAVIERHRGAKATRKGEVIPNGVDTDTYHPDGIARERVRRELELGEAFAWIAVGRLMWKKNYPAMIDAMRSLSGAQLLIAGAGPDEVELRSRAAGLNVRFLGERADVPALLNAADGFVLSSLVEGLPLALLEAAACGLPSIATDVGGVRETGIGVVVENAGDLASAMQQLQSTSPAARDRMGREARAIVLERYSMQAVTAQWEALYRTLLTQWT